MSEITRLNEIISKNMADFDKSLQGIGEQDVKNLFDQIINKSHKADKTSFLRIENYQFFLLCFFLDNINTTTYNQAQAICFKLRDTINNWQFDNVQKDLSNIIAEHSKKDQNKAALYTFLNDLGLPLEFLNYKTNFISVILYYFLDLKNKVNQINSSNQEKRLKQSKINKLYLSHPIFRHLNSLQKLISDLSEYAKYANDVALHKTKYTKEVKVKVDDGSILDLKEIPDKWHRYLELDLLEEIYHIIECNQQKSYQELETLLEKKQAIVYANPLIMMLYQKGVDPNSLNQELLHNIDTKLNYQEVLSIIDFLLSLNISLYQIFNEYSYLLFTLTPERLDKMQFFLNNHVLNKDTLAHNIDLLASRFDDLVTNYQILKPYLDFNNIFYSDQLLLKTPAQIKDILSVLNNYQMSHNNFIFLLCHYEYLPIYDLIIENDYHLLNLFISICETTNPLNTLKRILIYQQIDEEYATVNNLLKKDVTKEERFPLPDTALDSYLPHYANYLYLPNPKGTRITNITSSPIVKQLNETLPVIHDCYVIGSLTISRPKFLRNFEAVNQNIDLLIPCLLHNTFFTQQDYLNVVTSLHKLTLTYQKDPKTF